MLEKIIAEALAKNATGFKEVFESALNTRLQAVLEAKAKPVCEGDDCGCDDKDEDGDDEKEDDLEEGVKLPKPTLGKDVLAKAQQMGADAFKGGIKRQVVLDKTFDAYAKANGASGISVNSTAIMKAWYKGYDLENAKAPVDLA